MATNKTDYPAKLDIEYPGTRDKFTTLLRLFYALPILILVSMLVGSGSHTTVNEAGKELSSGGGGISGGLVAATALMIIFRQKYPKWWFSFSLELNRFMTRISAYILLLTDRYPSTDDEQSVHLDVAYPNVKRDLNRWMPLVKWLLALPHYIVVFFLVWGVFMATIVAWFSILFSGTYPRALFDFVVGVGRWCLRVNAYAFLLTTDEYPPFSLQ